MNERDSGREGSRESEGMEGSEGGGGKKGGGGWKREKGREKVAHAYVRKR